MSDNLHVFDYLNYWAVMSDDEIKENISNENIKILNEARSLLSKEQVQDVDSMNFVSMVHQMRSLYVSGSRGLSELILETSDLKDSGNIDLAIKECRKFIACCPSPFYIEKAEFVLKKLLGS